MLSEFFKNKSRELAYALTRVSFYIKRTELRSRLENGALELLENGARTSVDDNLDNLSKIISSISVLDSLVRFGHSIYEIEPVNATILVRELDGLNSAIRQHYKLDEQLPNLEEMFSYLKPANLFTNTKPEKSKELKVASNEDVPTNNQELKNQELVNLEDRGSGSTGIVAAIRQSAIVEKVRSGNGGGCRLKDLVAEFPEVSERTLRYDLQRLCERGLVERVGNGGPASYYRLAGEASVRTNIEESGRAVNSSAKIGLEIS